MSDTVFFAWQSDQSKKVNKNFIRKAIDRAIAKLNADLSAENAIRTQSDTEDVPGSPDIAVTIFRRIEESFAFVADVTSVAKTAVRSFPNPNVMIEYGWALAKLTDARVITVFNQAFGNWESDLPFDMRHKRKPCLYNLPENSSDDERNAALMSLTNQLAVSISVMLKYREVMPPVQPAIPNPEAFAFARKDYLELQLPNRREGRFIGFWVGAIPSSDQVSLGRIWQRNDWWAGRLPVRMQGVPIETIDGRAARKPTAVSPIQEGAVQVWDLRFPGYKTRDRYFDLIVRLAIRSNGSIALCVKTDHLEPRPGLNIGWIIADVANVLRTIEAIRKVLSTEEPYALMLELRYDEHSLDRAVPVPSGEWLLNPPEDLQGHRGTLMSSHPKAFGPHAVRSRESWQDFLFERYLDINDAAGQRSDAGVVFSLD
jgi:hypothetical protein